MNETVVIVPFANESDMLMHQEMKEKHNFLIHHKNEDYFMIFVNDKAWKDTSKDVIFYEVFGHDNPNCILIHNMEPMSIKGGAIYSGLKFAIGKFPDAKLIGFTDFDHSLDMDDAFSKIVASADVYIAIRRDRAPIDKLKHILFSFFVKMLFPRLSRISDLFACFKFFTPVFINDYLNRKIINDVTPMFEIDILIFALKNGYKISQYKVNWEDLPGTGRTFKNIVRMFKAVIRKRFLIPRMPVYRF